MTQKRIAISDITIQDVIVADNHLDPVDKYHYVSPQYYVMIDGSAINKFKTTDKITKDTSYITILDSVNKLKESMKKKYNTYSTKEKPWLSYVPIDVIKNMDTDERDRTFIHTTITAVLTHCKLQEHVSEIEDLIEKYRAWRQTTEG